MRCQRLKDQYVQNWGASLENSSKLEYYRKYKTYFCQEDYLNSIVNDNLRVQLYRFRTSSHICLKLKWADLLVLLEIVVYANYVL